MDENYCGYLIKQYFVLFPNLEAVNVVKRIKKPPFITYQEKRKPQVNQLFFKIYRPASFFEGVGGVGGSLNKG